MDYLDHHKSYYMELLKKRKRQDLEGGGVISFLKVRHNEFEPPLDKINKIMCAPSKDSDQPEHSPKEAWLLSYHLSAQRRLIRFCLFHVAKNKGADQTAHPRSLIGVFVVRFLDSIILIPSIVTISRL